MSQSNSHTHCQVAQADTRSKTWQRVCLFQRSSDRQSTRRTEGQQPTAVLRNGGCSCKLKVIFSNQLLWCIDSFELRNPARTQSVETLDKIHSAHFVQRPRATHVSDFRSRSEHSSNTCLAHLSRQRFAFPCQQRKARGSYHQ
jgi:hypothetical protein